MNEALLTKAFSFTTLSYIRVNYMSCQLERCVARLSSENDKLGQMSGDVTQKLERLDAERLQLKKEVKELKFRETRNLADCSELEEENIQLQKQVRFTLHVVVWDYFSHRSN